MNLGNNSKFCVVKREVFWDNIKGVLIALVVFAHCLFDFQEKYYWTNYLVDAIYFFHMPVFVFVSGYFSKSEKSKNAKSIWRLVIAYFLIISVYIMYDVYCGVQATIIQSYYSEWYLMALIVWRVLTPHLVNISKNIIPITIFSILSGFWPDLGGNGTLAIAKVVAFWPFFGGGYILREETVHRMRASTRKIKFGLGGIALISAIFIGYFSYKYLEITDHDLLPSAYNNIGLREPMAKISIMIVSTLLLTRAGRNSLSIYLLHRPLTLIFSKTFENYPDKTQIVLALIFTVMSLVVLGSNYLAEKINHLLDSYANVLSNNGKVIDDNEKNIKVSLFVIVSVVFVVPVVIQFLRMKN